MKLTKRILALLLVALMALPMLVACGGEPQTEEEENTTPLVVGYSPFSSKFSPFFSETAYDQDAYAMTQLGLLTSDRTGAIITNGIKGETKNYNGTDYTYYGPADLKITENDDGSVDYDITLREDLVFSDGEKLTIDDVIFSMYVLCDPTYEGNSTLFAQPIKGMQEYRSGMDTVQNLILATKNEGYEATDYFTEEQYTAYWTAYEAAGLKFVAEIVEYCAAYGATNAAEAADLWSFEDLGIETEADFWAEIVKAYDYTPSAINGEAASSNFTELLEAELGDKYAEYVIGVNTGDSAANITGIVKTGDYSMRVTTTEIDATTIYQLGVSIAPIHYYGSKDLYDYDNNKFGFPKGDLSSVRAKTSQPMGAGPYKFIKFENGVINYERNDNYYLGAPKTKFVNFLECTTEDDKLNGITTGTVDITDPSINKDVAASIKQTNSNGELTGDKIQTSLVNNLGYGYIGMNAVKMNINNEPDSDASKNLRKAMGTVLCVYRDLSVDTYYGELASVINYPISDTSWAAPRPSDDGYKLAFSTDVEGNDIYTSKMTPDERYAAALEASLGYFEAAGYTVEDGKVTAGPEGGRTTFELWIPADGKGDHPSFMICTEAADALKTIGIELIVKDLTNSSELWPALEAQSVDMWAAAWGATVDPDMYQIYYSDVANADQNSGQGNPIGGPAQGGSNYQYAIADAKLDELIMDARRSTDQAYRKSMYKACLDIIIDWAVEIPVYQRQNCVTFSAERVNLDTVTPDITTFYGWLAEVQNIELK